MPDAAPAMVERRARIFRFGHYPAKRWGITREEFVAANGEAGTIPIGLDPVGKGHYVGRESWLDGETGTAEFSVEGDEVFATLRLPELIERAARKVGAKLSAVFHPTAKTLSKVDLVEKPHIADAVLFAEEHGDVLVFEDDEPEPAVVFCDEDVRSFAQEMHDLAAEHHANFCDPSVPLEGPTEADHHCRMLHDYAVREGGAYCPGLEPEDDDEEAIAMSDEIDELREENERLKAELAERPARAVAFEEETPREKALRERTERLEAQLIDQEAVAFAAEVTKADKDGKVLALPRERQEIVRQYKRAAMDDARLPEAITFTEGTASVEGSRVDAFKAGFGLRPKVAINAEKAVGFNLDEEPATGAKDEDEKAAREERRKRNHAYVERNNPAPAAR